MALVSDHTLDSLIATLVAGDEVEISQTAQKFSLPKPGSRAALAYYGRERRYWEKNISEDEIAGLLRALDTPPSKTHPPVVTPRTPPKWWAKTLRCHRFAGLQVHCDSNGAAPPIVEVDLDHRLTVFSGFNGAGKTSLLSAIVWCLTGRALRSQDLPRELTDPIAANRIDQSQEGENEEEDVSDRILNLPPPIVPVPTAAQLEAIGDEPATDTWVEIVFRNSTTGEEKVVRRTLQRKGKKYSAPSTVSGDLGVTELVLSVGTVMPTTAANLRFDEKNDLGDAVAKLTGFKPLADFGRRVNRLIDTHLKKKQVEKTRSEMDQALIQYRSQQSSLVRHLEEHPDLGLAFAEQSPSEIDQGNIVVENLKSLDAELLGLEATALNDFEVLLGNRPNLALPKSANDLATQIQNADLAVRGAELSSLPSIALTTEIGKLSDQEIDTVAGAIAKILADAVELENSLREVEKAQRKRLYVLVAQWHQEVHGAAPLDRCPVCNTNLDSVAPDQVLNSTIRLALENARSASKNTALTIATADREWARTFFEALPQKFQTLLGEAIPESLWELYRAGFINELFKKPDFQRLLAPLRGNIETRWEQLAVNFPPSSPDDLVAMALPASFGKDSTLQKRLNGAARIIAIARYRSRNSTTIKTVLDQIIGKSELPAKDMEKRRAPLRCQLEVLRRAAANAYPITVGRQHVSEMQKYIGTWASGVSRLSILKRAAEALEPLRSLPSLVESEVGGILRLLDSDIKTWINRIYQSHYIGGPQYAGLSEAPQAGLGILANIGEVSVPAHTVLNASALRAYVWAFLFALWERVEMRLGSIGLFILDDPQTLFDRVNSENFAAAVPLMSKQGMQPIVTTNDPSFLSQLKDYGRKCMGEEVAAGFFDISPISRSKPCILIAPSIEKIALTRAEWEADENSVDKAQRFVREVRTYIEAKLWDLLASDPTIMNRPTLADLLGRIRANTNSGQQPFEQRPFVHLARSRFLDSGSDFYRIINKAHHEGYRLITPQEAALVEPGVEDVRKAIEACWITYARWIGRLGPAAEPEYTRKPHVVTTMILDNKPLPILGSLAAKESAAFVVSPSQGAMMLSLRHLGPVCLYALRTKALGLEALPGQTLIASDEDEPGNGDLVVGRVGGNDIARRLLLPRDEPGTVILESSRSASGNVPPSSTCRRHSIALRKIVGVLFDNQNIGGTGDIAEVNASPALSSVETAALVREGSAYPVAKDGDIVLLTSADPTSETELRKLEGRIVAVELALQGKEGQSVAYLKRVGLQVPGQVGLRVLNNVGSSVSGNEEIVVFPVQGHVSVPSVLVVKRLWRVMGIIFKTSTRNLVQGQGGADA